MILNCDFCDKEIEFEKLKPEDLSKAYVGYVVICFECAEIAESGESLTVKNNYEQRGYKNE